MGEWYNSPAGSNEVDKQSAQTALSATTTLNGTGLKLHGTNEWNRSLQLDGMTYHRLHGYSIPPSIVEVDVNVIDNGVTFPSVMVAGTVGATVLDSSNDLPVKQIISATGVGDTIAPVAGWWLYVKRGAEQTKLNELISKLSRENSGFQGLKPAGSKRPVMGGGGRLSGASRMRKWIRSLLPCLTV